MQAALGNVVAGRQPAGPRPDRMVALDVRYVTISPLDRSRSLSDAVAAGFVYPPLS